MRRRTFGEETLRWTKEISLKRTERTYMVVYIKTRGSISNEKNPLEQVIEGLITITKDSRPCPKINKTYKDVEDYVWDEFFRNY